MTDNTEKILKILVFGSIPPPIGGVTKSVQNLLSALKNQSIFVELFTRKSFFKSYEVAHVHYSKSWKRFVGLMLGKLLAKKVIFTLHGNKYSNDFFNKLNSIIADGAILLNDVSYKKYSNLFKKSIILTSLFKEGVKINIQEINLLKNDNNIKYLLLYASNKVFQDGNDIYGVDFILNNIYKLRDEYVVVFLDPNQSYIKYIKGLDEKKLIYIDHEVDFFSLLSEIDIYIRPSSTDGNSVAIQEALMLGKKVVASDVVNRPIGVCTYRFNDFEDFQIKLSEEKKSNLKYEPDSIDKYLYFLHNDIISIQRV